MSLIAWVSHPWIRAPRARATTNHRRFSEPEAKNATAVPRTTAVCDHKRTGLRRNSRNHPFALPAQLGRGGMAAKSLTIGIVILERSRMAISMDVPQPRYPQDGWGRRFMDKRMWYLIVWPRGGSNRARILCTPHDRPSNVNHGATGLRLAYH